MKKSFITLILSGIIFIPSFAQNGDNPPKAPAISFKKGIAITAPDSNFSVNFRFRMQSRALYSTVSGNDLSASEIEARVRRLRLRLEGFMFNPKLTYLIQLSFSRGDMDWSVRDNSLVNVSPNVVRDAAVYYSPSKSWMITFGQTKLPGNRQRVVSSGDLQFMDRSIVNAAFNIDRDFGLQVWYNNNIGGFVYKIKTAISTGEGRNVQASDFGLAYTGRIELLPFGDFTNKGDYFEGDLEREQTPKLSIAGGLSYNENAKRAGGQLGKDLYEGRDITTWIFDGLLKYKGFALYSEYVMRDTEENPITVNASGEKRHVLTGEGKLIQGSYVFKNFYEIAARYAVVTPFSAIRARENQEQVFTLGGTKYLRGHRLKLQSNLSYHILTNLDTDISRENWSLGFQVELGI